MEFRSRYTTVRSRYTSLHQETFRSWYTAAAQNLDQSIPPLKCSDHSIPFRSKYTLGTFRVLDLSYPLQNCLDLGIRNFLDQNPHPFLDLSHRDLLP